MKSSLRRAGCALKGNEMNDYEIRQLKNIAMVNSQCVAAQIEMEAMKALNMEREQRGESLVYGEAAFMKIIDTNALGWNSIIAALNRD